MKKKRILRVFSVLGALCLLVICPLSISAATLPQGGSDRSFTITADTLQNGTKSITATTYSISQGYISVHPTVTWLPSSSVTGMPAGGLMYQLMGDEYRRQDITNFYALPSAAMNNITNQNSFDWFFSTEIKVYIPATFDSVTTSLMRTCTCTPIFGNSSGDVYADLEHAVQFSPGSRLETVNNTSYRVYTYSFNNAATNKDKYIPVSPLWLPDGYFLSGFSFNFVINRGSSNPDQEYTIPVGNWFYFGEIAGVGYGMSSATSRAIQQQTVDLTQELNSVGQSISTSIQSSADQISSAIQDSTDQIINADFGYTAPTQGNTDDGLAMGNNLVNDMNSKMANFSNDIGNAQTEIISDMSAVSGVVNNIWSTVPAAVVALVVAYLVFLVVRKLTGR